MKRYAIVDLKSLEILNTYDSDRMAQDQFGGPWGDSSKTIHLRIPMGLTAIKCVMAENVQAEDSEGNLMEHLVPGPTQVAHDGNGRVILDEEGKPLLVSSFVYVPEMVSELRIVQK